MATMTNEMNPDGSQPAPGNDPWATTLRQHIDVPPPAESQFARPAENPWQAPANPYAAATGEAQPATHVPPYAGAPVPPAAVPQAPNAGGWAPAPAPRPGGMGALTGDANPLAALFDFSFTKFATPGLVKIVYILEVIAAVGMWLVWIIAVFAGSRLTGGGAGLGIVVLLFGWIPVLLSIAFTRFVLEAIVALIRINDRVAEMAERSRNAA